MQRIIMHIDMNSYFASVAQQDNPAWRGRPLGVCEHLGGIIIAPSVEAKKWGVKTAMPVWEAKKLCPQIILTKTTPDRYRFFTAKFMKLLSNYTDQVEQYSIDEAFLDITRVCNIKVQSGKKEILGVWEKVDPFAEAERIAKEIKRRIKTEVGDYLRCSVGIAWNKLVAKIGSDMQKPDGLVVLRQTDKEYLYDKLVLTDIPGIANRQEKNLKELGIRSLRDLRDYPVSMLKARFGINGYHLHRMGQLEGTWKETVENSDRQKSIGHVYTIAREYRDEKSGELVLYKLSEMVGLRLREAGLMATGIFVGVVFQTNEYFHKSKKFSVGIDDGRDIFLFARNLIYKMLGSLGTLDLLNGAKQIGITAFGLQTNQIQLSLFTFDQKKRLLVKAIDEINAKHEAWVNSSQTRSTAALGSPHGGMPRGFVIGRVPGYLARGIIRDSIGFKRK